MKPSHCLYVLNNEKFLENKFVLSEKTLKFYQRNFINQISLDNFHNISNDIETFFAREGS